MNKISILFLAFIFTAMSVNAQNITGKITDASGKAMANATVSLLKAKDSSVVKLNVTNNDGVYTFKNMSAGKYLISSSYVGYGVKYSSSVDVQGSTDVTVNTISLEKPTGDLKAVVVTAKKPMIEVKADKTVFNVENSINAVGSDALELLRKSPGVLVDRDDNLSLSGKNGVQIYIDGRPSPLSGKDLSDFLKTLQSSQIEAIEIITNPSAKYDAAGNAGIINIRLKKNKLYGTNGSVNAGYGIGIYGKYNAGISLNHRDDKLNLFGNYNYNKSKNENFMNLYRTAADTLFDQRGTMINRNNSHGFKAGFDYFANKKSTFGVIVTGNFNDNSTNNYSKTAISYIPTNTPVKTLIADNKQPGSRDNMNFNGNYRYVDTAGRELNIDANYGYYKLYSDQYQPNIYYTPSGVEISREIYRMVSPGKIDIANLKLDYDQNLKGGRLSFGAKTSFVKSNPDFQRYNVLTSGSKYDSSRSNQFDYKENVNALYANYNKQFKGFMIQVGLRAENTHAQGTSNGFKENGGGSMVSYDSSFDRKYTDLFPSAAITFNKNPMNQWSLTYSRRIDRPSYQDLNPFEFKLDAYTYQKGNTQLTPQYTNSFGITNSYKYRLTTTLNYSHVKDIFAQLVDTTEKSKSYITKKNLATQDIVSINISYPFQYKWYSVYGNFNGYYSHYKADFGGGNRVVNLEVWAYNFYAQNTFNLGKGYTAELSGWYTSPSIWQGTFKSKQMGGVDVGMQKSLLKGKANLKLSVTDVFQTMRWGGTSNFAGQYTKASGGWESRQFKVNFSYRFGKTSVKAARQRKTGTEDENSRVDGGGGLGGK